MDKLFFNDALARIAGMTAGLAGICLLGGCLGGPKLQTPKFDAPAAATAAMQLHDANKDGQIGRWELKDCPGLREAVPDADTNGDGALSEEEIIARIETYAEVQLALIPFECRFFVNKRPLKGATVRLVPLEFLEGMIRPADGVTDDSGLVAPAVDDPVAKAEGVTGVNAGFYRIKVSLVDSDGKETISAKYNSETTLGCDVGHTFHRGVTRFDLASR